MKFDIQLAKTQSELKELYQFRYKIYIEELSRTQKAANHKTKEIREPLDESAQNFVAYHEGKLVGAVRFNFCNKSDNDDYFDVYKMNLFEKYYPDRISYVTKLIVLPEYRNRIVALKLAVICYELGMQTTYFNIIDCYQPMIPFFLRLGYRFYTENSFHHEFGEVTPMVLLSRDFEHLRKVKSPFVNAEKGNHKEDDESLNFFRERFETTHKEIYNRTINQISIP